MCTVISINECFKTFEKWGNFFAKWYTIPEIDAFHKILKPIFNHTQKKPIYPLELRPFSLEPGQHLEDIVWVLLLDWIDLSGAVVGM
jgi:hypothetical protein